MNIMNFWKYAVFRSNSNKNNSISYEESSLYMISNIPTSRKQSFGKIIIRANKALNKNLKMFC